MKRQKPKLGVNKLKVYAQQGAQKPIGMGHGMASAHPHRNLGKYLHKPKKR